MSMPGYRVRQRSPRMDEKFPFKRKLLIHIQPLICVGDTKLLLLLRRRSVGRYCQRRDGRMGWDVLGMYLLTKYSKRRR